MDDSTTRNDFVGLWDVRETAKRLRVSESWVRKRVADKTLPCVRMGSRVLFDPADLRDWIAERKAVA